MYKSRELSGGVYLAKGFEVAGQLGRNPFNVLNEQIACTYGVMTNATLTRRYHA